LFSEFIANDRPLYVRYKGESYFPVIRFYPDDIFTRSGRSTRPDFKAIRASDEFNADSSNVMIFPPVPYGPNEIINPEKLKSEEQVSVMLKPVPRLGSVNIDKAFNIVRSQSAEYFLPAQTNESLLTVWPFPPALVDSIQKRFANQPDAPQRVILTNLLDEANIAEISMATFNPRREAPRDVRMSFREASGLSLKPVKVTFSRNLKVVKGTPFWKILNEDERTTLLGFAKQGFEGHVPEVSIDIKGADYKAQILKSEVQWPFRPSNKHWWGIDSAGRDVFTRILYGLRISMTFGLLLVAFSMAFGIVMGAIQGYYGGRVDIISQRIIEIWSTIPFLYVMIWLGAIYGRSFNLLLFCYGIFNWIGISYYVRAEFLRLRNAPFVDAARCLGISSRHIMFRHILPNALTPIITMFPFLLVGAISSLAVLDFLGFGLPPPTASWGEMLQQAHSFRWAWWLIVYPTAALVSVIMLGVLIGEGIRDAYDPKPMMKME